MDDFEGFQASVEEVTMAVVETAREVGVELEDVTEFLKSWDKNWMGEELLHMGEPRKRFLEMQSTPGEDDMMTVEMTAKDSEYDINLVTWDDWL